MWRRQWHPTPVLLPGKSHGRRSLVGCSPLGRWGSDTTDRPHFHFSLSCIGEQNGNPLQCSCLENPRDGEPGGLPSMASHRVGHDWSDLAAAIGLSFGVCLGQSFHTGGAFSTQVQKTNTPEQVLMCLGHVFKSLNHSTSFLTLSMMTQEDYFSSYVSPIILCTHCGCISHLVAWYCYITNEP